ncbi:hypothetical protein ACQPZJ_30280 [Actinoplanes sp. CA-054009]
MRAGPARPDKVRPVWRRIVVALAATCALAMAGVWFVAVRGLQVSPAPWSLSALWISEDELTWISLRHDSTFTAKGISKCTGPVHFPGSTLNEIVEVDDIPFGEGIWNYSHDPHGSGDRLTMRFEKPSPLRLTWIVEGDVEWRFHPVSMTLGLVDQPWPTEEPCPMHTE